MTLDGAPASWVTLLPHLLSIHAREGMYRRSVWRCRCSSGDCDADPSEADLPGGVWSVCPYSLLRGAQFLALLQLAKCSTISPLAGWPDEYPAWLSWGLVVLNNRKGAK